MHDPQVLVIAAWSIGSWEILKRTFRWVDGREERRFRRWCDAHDDGERRWARRLAHLHVIDGDLAPPPNGAQRRVHAPSQEKR